MLSSHTETFAAITSIPAAVSQTGTEPPLSVGTRAGLFSIAHNALTNASMHAHPGRVEVALDFGADCVRLSVSDDGIGLPDDYAQRGRGFAGMTAAAERLGGHPIMRDGLRDALDSEDDFEVVGLAADGTEAVSAAQTLAPDVIVMDAMMPNKSGVDACREITDQLPDTRVLILTASADQDAIIDAVAAGATGYLHKHTAAQELADAVRDVARGRLRIPDRTVKRAFEMIREPSGLAAGGAQRALTQREQEILAMYAKGSTYAQIAEARGTKTVTVRNAIYRIQDKLGAGTKQQIVVWAVRNGLLDDTGQDR